MWDCETSLRIGADELAVGELGHAEIETSKVSLHPLKDLSHLISLLLDRAAEAHRLTQPGRRQGDRSPGPPMSWPAASSGAR
jgi:hypothetical protein